MCVCIRVYIHVCVCAGDGHLCGWLSACVCGGQRSTSGVIPIVLSTLFCELGSLSSTDLRGWLANKLKIFAYLWFSNAGIVSTCYHAWHLKYSSDNQLGLINMLV